MLHLCTRHFLVTTIRTYTLTLWKEDEWSNCWNEFLDVDSTITLNLLQQENWTIFFARLSLVGSKLLAFSFLSSIAKSLNSHPQPYCLQLMPYVSTLSLLYIFSAIVQLFKKSTISKGFYNFALTSLVEFYPNYFYFSYDSRGL